MTFGIIACVTLLSGYAPIPFELVKRRGRVVGIDFWFLLVDSCGAFFSLMSLGTFSSVGYQSILISWLQSLKTRLISSSEHCTLSGKL